MRKFLFILVSALFCSACEEMVDQEEIGLETKPDIYVIEGYVSNETGPFSVKITRSAAYFDRNVFKAVENASVNIADDVSQQQVLKYVGNGVYQTDKLQGIPGRTYVLTVKVDGKTFTGRSFMNPLVAVSNITYRYRQAVDHANEEGYFVTVEASDPGGRSNFYRVKAFINGVAFRDTDDYVTMADYTFDGGTLRSEFPAEYRKNDLAKIELWSLDYPSYMFYSSLGDQVNAPSKGPFGAQPGNIRSNITGGATGLFCAYSVSRAQVRIE